MGKRELELKFLEHTKSVLENGFFRNHLASIRSVCKKLREENPDYIIALSRKAPNLLELMQLSGCLEKDFVVISERAIDFMPPEELNGKKVVIFDDIIISGSTITQLLDQLCRKYEAEFKVMCIAIDRDTIALEKDSKGYAFGIRNGKKVYIDYEVSLSKDDRFIFCNEVVRCFAFLNKPYDLDYALFHTFVEDMKPFLSSLTLYKPFNLTTVYQSKNGFKRYTILPKDRFVDERLFDNIFHNLKSYTQIHKIRAYYNSRNMKLTLAPMVVFETTQTDLIQKGGIFIEPFAVLNDLIEFANKFMDSENQETATYRLLWYLVSYLYGLFFCIRNSRKNTSLFQFSVPSQNLHLKDITYLFGPFLSKEIIRFLNLHFTEFVESLKEISNSYFEKTNRLRELTSNKETLNVFDNERGAMYTVIKEYIRENAKKDTPLTNQMATIFEGLYLLKEMPTQDRLKESRLTPNDAKRLRTGFNFDQIVEILMRAGIIKSRSNYDVRQVSLALDFLVDAGVAIPIFHYLKKGIVERAYRYGEDALSARNYGYLIASVSRNLFDYVQKKNGKTLPKITFEKIGVMIQELIEKSGLVDILEKLVDTTDRTLKIAPDYYRHGKILSILDEKDDKSYMFANWCEKEGIIDYVGKRGGITYSNEYLANLKSPSEEYLRLVSRDRIALFTNLSILLYHIDRVIDREMQSDFLIALTTCCDHESYVRAVKKLLQLFFKSDKYRFDLPLSTISDCRFDNPSHMCKAANKSLDQLKDLSYSVANSIRHKKLLWNKMDGIIEEIEQYFGNNELRYTYEQNLSPQIELIKRAHGAPVEEPLRVFREDLEILGELCLELSTIFINLLKLCVRVCYPGRRKKVKGRLGNLKAVATRFVKSMDKWNLYIKQNPQVSFDGISVVELPSITYDSNKLTHFQFSVKECTLLLQELIPQIRAIYNKLENIYNVTYSPERWRKELGRIFQFEERFTQTKLKKAPWQWTIWYDIKDFSGGRNPKNKGKGKMLVEYLNERLEGTKENIKDGFFNLEEDDEKHIYIRSSENVLPYLHEIINSANKYQMSLRIGLCCVWDTNWPYLIHCDDNKLKTSRNHVLAKRLGNYLKEENKEKDDYHSIIIGKEAFRRLWSKPSKFNSWSKWKPVDGFEEKFAELRGLESYISFLIIRLTDTKRRTLDEFT